MKALRWIAIVVGAVAVLGLVYGGVMISMSESGEVVVLETLDAEGAPQETRLWVVEDAGYQWLRAGDPSSGWFLRLSATPAVTVTRGDVARRYRAVPVTEPAVRDRINQLMAEKYGFPDKFIETMVRDSAGVVAVRLEPTE